MSELNDRAGIFLVPAQFTDELQRANDRVAALEFADDGSYAPPAWYLARHDFFERLLAVAVAHRILPAETRMDLAEFTSSVDKRERRARERSSPSARRDLAAKHLAKLANSQLRAALAEVLSHDAGPGAGLWIETEAAPATPDLSEPCADISPADLARRLTAYVDEADRAEAARARRPGPQRRACLCEVTDETVRGSPTSVRQAALFSILDETGEFTGALEELCESAPVESISRCAYTGAQARDLLAWVEAQRRSATRALMLRVLKRAVANGHAFAIVAVS